MEHINEFTKFILKEVIEDITLELSDIGLDVNIDTSKRIREGDIVYFKRPLTIRYRENDSNKEYDYNFSPEDNYLVYDYENRSTFFILNLSTGRKGFISREEILERVTKFKITISISGEYRWGDIKDTVFRLNEYLTKRSIRFILDDDDVITLDKINSIRDNATYTKFTMLIN